MRLLAEDTEAFTCAEDTYRVVMPFGACGPQYTEITPYSITATQVRASVGDCVGTSSHDSSGSGFSTWQSKTDGKLPQPELTCEF